MTDRLKLISTVPSTWTGERCDEGGILLASAFPCGRDMITAVVVSNKKVGEMLILFALKCITFYDVRVNQ